jgi:hypothetical protein
MDNWKPSYILVNNLHGRASNEADQGRPEEERSILAALSEQIEEVPQERAVPPFNEPIYTVKQVAEIWQMSAAQVTKLFEHEPGVRDFAPIQFFGRRRKRMLRIPHSVMERVWNRVEVRPTSAVRTPQGRPVAIAPTANNAAR